MSLTKSIARLVCLGLVVAVSAQVVSEAQQRAAVPDGTPEATDSTVQAQIDFARATRASHAAIEKKLAGKTEPIQGGESLKSILDFVAEVHDIHIVADKQTLDDAGAESLDNIMVSEDLSIQGIRVGSALEIILTQLEEVDTSLDYILEHEVLKITTKDAADMHYDTRIYNVDRLVPTVPIDELVAVVEAMAEFGERDGTHAKPLGKRLVVRHNRRIHQKVADLLSQLMAP